MTLYPVASSRVSDQLTRTRLTSQLQTHRSELANLQDQISTGQRIQRPSDDSPAAIRAMALQRLLEQREQIKSNLTISQSFVAATDASLTTVSDRIIDIRGQVVDIADSGASDDRRDLLIQDINAAIQELVNVGNREFRGRRLFAGTVTGVEPFEIRDGHVIYHGNDRDLSSFVDAYLVSATNTSGHAVFGAISDEVIGTTDLNPVVRSTTRLDSLNGGDGVDRGTILVSDGATTKTIDLSTAETLGDVIRLLQANPPTGRTITASLSDRGLIVDIDDAGGGSLTIRNSAEGRTASQLGIENSSGAGLGPIVGSDVNPQIGLTTQLSDLLGSRATTSLSSDSLNSDIVVEASTNGTDLNGVTVRFVENSATGNQATASYDAAAKELVVDISEGATTAATVISAINAEGTFTARLDTSEEPTNNGSGTVDLGASGVTDGGSGKDLDQTSGLQINTGGKTHILTFESAETVEDLLNILNHSEADLLAEINASGTGIDVRSRLSGADFQIGENGGTTATELGLRTFHLDSRLDTLNYGRGIEPAPGTDFVIRRKDGTELQVDISTAETVGDVIARINSHPDNTGDSVTAKLADFGNGIELFDSNGSGSETLTVTRASSFAAWGLGLVPQGDDAQMATTASTSSASINFPPSQPPNTAFTITAGQAGYALNGVEIFLDDARTGDVADASYDGVNKRLTIHIDATATSANTIVSAIAAEGTFSAALDTSGDPSNDGTGIPGATGLVATTSGGADERIQGRDVRPLETHGIFNTLIRLRAAVADFDLVEIGRVTDRLDEDFRRLNFARAELGSRGQLFDAIERRIGSEELEMRSALSEELDTDMVQAVSELTARQANFQATLQMIGRISQLTVLNFI